jgi:glutaredoxin
VLSVRRPQGKGEREMLTEIRSLTFRALTSRQGNWVPPVRWTKDVLLFLNDMAGKPLATREEILEREEREQTRRQRLAEARAAREQERAANGAAAAGGSPAREAAPVVVYVDEKSTRDLKRIRGVLEGREIPFQTMDVEHDEASRSWVQTTAKTHDLPVVFVAGEPVGGYDALVQLDVTGELVRRVFG